MRLSVVITTFSRPKLFEKCLKSVCAANYKKNFKIIVIQQKGNEALEKIIKKNEKKIDYLFKIDSLGRNPLENINLNRMLGNMFAYNILKDDFVLGIEDDSVLAPDALEFTKSIFFKYKNEKYFRGINLGSFENHENVGDNAYSILRYGLNGHAGGLSRETWQKFNERSLIRNSNSVPLDSMLENYVKTGFMVTPNKSRYVNYGWDGTHGPKNPADDFYIKIDASFKSLKTGSKFEYVNVNIKHNWRNDCVIFKKSDNFKYYLHHTVDKLPISATNIKLLHKLLMKMFKS